MDKFASCARPRISAAEIQKNWACASHRDSAVVIDAEAVVVNAVVDESWH